MIIISRYKKTGRDKRYKYVYMLPMFAKIVPAPDGDKGLDGKGNTLSITTGVDIVYDIGSQISYNLDTFECTVYTDVEIFGWMLVAINKRSKQLNSTRDNYITLFEKMVANPNFIDDKYEEIVESGIIDDGIVRGGKL